MKTAVFPWSPGIGDMIWHLPFIRAIAAQSAGGKVTVVARSSTLAKEWLAVDPCVEEVIYSFRAARKKETRILEGDSLSPEKYSLVAELKARGFDRIYHFNHRTKAALASMVARIPVRAGYGYNYRARLFLNTPPYVQRIRTDAHPVIYFHAARLSEAHGFTTGNPVPRMFVPDEVLERLRGRFNALSDGPIVAFSVGASEVWKNWGPANFAALATALVRQGCGVVALGGPAEERLNDELSRLLADDVAPHVEGVVSRSVLESAAMLRECACLVGNDTGMLNVAAANEVPTLGLFGATPPLKHDPAMLAVEADSMEAISVAEVMGRLTELGWLD